MGDPVGAMSMSATTMAADGTCMLVEPFANDRLEDNLNPVGRIFYAASTMICTPASLDQEVGLALGAQAGEARLREVAQQRRPDAIPTRDRDAVQPDPGGAGIRRSTALPSPPVLPDFLADQAGDARLLLGDRNDPALGRAAGDFEQQLGPDRLLEFVAVLDRDHERSRSADDAVLVIEIEVVDVHGRIGRLLHHDRQAVDDDPLLQRRVARAGDRRAVVVRAVTGNIDDAPQP